MVWSNEEVVAHLKSIGLSEAEIAEHMKPSVVSLTDDTAIKRAWTQVKDSARGALNRFRSTAAGAVDDPALQMIALESEESMANAARATAGGVAGVVDDPALQMIALEEEVTAGAARTTARGAAASVAASTAVAAVSGAIIGREVLDAYSTHADSVDVKRHMTEAGVSSTAGVGAGLAAGGAISGAMSGGALAFGLATGGAAVGAVAAAAAVKYAMHKADSAMYGAEDARFSTDEASQSHMGGLAEGKFRDQLVDPQTGEINLNDIATLNRLQGLAQREVYRQREIMSEHSSWAPRWMRNGDSVVTQEQARSDMNIAQSAVEEAQIRINDINSAEQKINGLFNSTDPIVARDRDAIVSRALAGNSTPEQRNQDSARLGAMLGDPTLGEALLGQIEHEGNTDRARRAASGESLRLEHADAERAAPKPRPTTPIKATPTLDRDSYTLG